MRCVLLRLRTVVAVVVGGWWRRDDNRFTRFVLLYRDCSASDRGGASGAGSGSGTGGSAAAGSLGDFSDDADEAEGRFLPRINSAKSDDGGGSGGGFFSAAGAVAGSSGGGMGMHPGIAATGVPVDMQPPKTYVCSVGPMSWPLQRATSMLGKGLAPVAPALRLVLVVVALSCCAGA